MVNKFATIAILIFSTFSVIAQSHFSPYSYYGLGEIGNVDNATYIGAGNNTFNHISDSKLNTFNPASYSYIKPELPLFGIGVSSRFSQFDQNEVSEKAGYTNISEMAFGLSFANYLGLGFGLKPYSRRGYGFKEFHTVEDDIFIYEYNGEGNINQAFGGVSGTIIKWKTLNWTVGAQFSSLFGSLLNERKSYLEGISEAGIEYNSLRIKSMQYEFGTVISDTIAKGHIITLSGTFQPSQNLNAYTNTQLFSASNSTNIAEGLIMNVDNPSQYTFISQTGEVKRQLAIAQKLGIGFDYTYAPRTRKDSSSYERNFQWKVLGAYTLTDWTNAGFKDALNEVPFYQLKASSLHFGVQFTPETQILSGNPSTFFERINYSVGFYQKQLPFAFNNVQLTEFGTTFGFGIPILTQRTESSLQFGCVLGKRGTSETGSLNEQFVGVNVGLIIAPSRFDRWFVKRKLD